MSSKYTTGGDVDRILVDDAGHAVSLTDHAIHRWGSRTPHDCPIGIREAWQRGEAVKHPAVATAKGKPEPDTVRVYRHCDEWGVAFVVVENPEQPIPHRTDRVVVTICAIQTFDHGPTRAYLHSHGPHHSGGDNE